MEQDLKNSIMKTGTTIVAIVCKDGVVMASDRRATAGNVIMAKKEQKSVKITDYLVISSCGSAADSFLSEKVIAAELKLKELHTRVRPTVKEAAHLIGMMYYRNIRSPSMVPHIVGTLVSGFNEDGTIEAYTIEPAGGVYPVHDFDANFGSGMPYVLGFLERMYKPDISIEKGVDLAVECIKSSTQRDTASGNGIDVFTVTKDNIKHVVSQEILPSYK